MRFQSKWSNYRFYVLPTRRTVDAVGFPQLIPGLSARFTGPQRIFDSALAQQQNGWTDEQRVAVEDRIRSSEDWGNGIYLAPGEKLSPKDQKRLKTEDISLNRCAHIEVIDGNVQQCENEAQLGDEFCETHDRTAQARVSGLLQTK